MITVNIPIPIGWALFTGSGVICGILGAWFWLALSNYCDMRPAPRWIPWRCNPCEGCARLHEYRKSAR